MFVNNTSSILSSTELMVADDSKILHFVRNGDDHAALQNDLNLLHEWSVCWQLNFNISKCKYVYLGPVHNFGSCYLNGIMIDSVESHKHEWFSY